jgi:hypothetical protein
MSVPEAQRTGPSAPSDDATGSWRAAVALALVGGLAWVAKFLIMLAQDGPESDSVPENAAFFLGLVAVALAAVTLGWHLARGRSLGLRLLAAAGGLLALAGVLGVLQLALTALPGDAWQQEEAVFLVLGSVAAAGAVVAIGRRRSS